MKYKNFNTCIIKTKIGNIFIEIKDYKVIKIFPTNLKITDFKYLSSNTLSLFRPIKQQIEGFLEGKVTYFSFSIQLQGSSFQKRVWNEVKKIKYGKTSSYSDIAKKIDSSPRAVGLACSKNTNLFIIPCHRVINSSGNLGGYIMGKNTKNYLLNMEKNNYDFLLL